VARQAPVVAALAAALLAGPARADDVRLTSLDWPPFTQLDGKGLTDQVVARALAAAGWHAQVDYRPWNRATAIVRSGAALGYYPEYASPEMEQSCLLSHSLGVSQVGFAERVTQPVEWTSLDQLAGLPIGVVSGYVNTPDFDRYVRDGVLRVDAAVTDEMNLKKLAAGRIRLAVIDRQVMEHLLATTPELQPFAHAIRFNPRPLRNQTLHVCFRKDEDGRRARDALDQGLEKVR
jgi:polar amino acid transport system substrate-binding protein